MRIVGGDEHVLAREADGFRAGEAGAAAGDDYELVLDGEAWPDPCSRFQPEGAREASRVVDPGAFAWTDAAWEDAELDELVLYELHGDDDLRAFYRRLIELRRRLPREVSTQADDGSGLLHVTRGDVMLTADLRTRTVEIEE